MTMVLKNYQEEAVQNIVAWLDKNPTLTAPDGVEGFALLEAPTGAGKTVMLASVLSRACQNTAALLISPGKGNLEEQTYKAVKKYLSDTQLKVARLDEAYLSSNAFLPAGTVAVTNWEELVGKNKKTGESLKKIVRGKETITSLHELLRNTAERNIPFLIVNDEAHYGKGKKGTTGIEELLAEIANSVGHRPFILEATATPTTVGRFNTQALQGGYQRHEKIDKNDVINEGMLVKTIQVNTGVQQTLDEFTDSEQDSITAEKLAFEAAWKTKEHLDQLYEENNIGVKSLILIQVPNNKQNSDAGDKKVELVTSLLAEKGVTEENGKLARLMSGDRTDQHLLDTIKNSDSPVVALFFKQSISMGWDCPRANILLGFREIGTEIFGIQTIGRIMRTPEQKHYNIFGAEQLDDAYLFTTFPTTYYQRQDDKPPTDFSFAFYRQHPPIILEGQHVSRDNAWSVIRPKTLTDALRASTELKKLAAEINNDKDVIISKTSMMTDQTVTLKEIFDGDVVENENTKVNVSQDDATVEVEYVARLTAIIGDAYKNKKKTFNIVKPAVYRWARENIPWLNDTDNFVLGVQKLFLYTEYKEKLLTTFRTIIAECAATDVQTNKRTRVVNEKPWMPAEQFMWTEKNTLILPLDLLAEKHLYFDGNGNAALPTKTLSKPEKSFHDNVLLPWIRDNKIVWWYKNGDSQQGSEVGDSRFFGLVYENEDGEKKAFYPDYIVLFADGTTGIFEVKDEKMAHRKPGLDETGGLFKAQLLTTRYADNPDILAGVTYPLPESDVFLLVTDVDQPETDTPLVPLK